MSVASVRLGPKLKELRLHLCQTSASSNSLQKFIHENYVSIKKKNPKFPILIRECSGIQPRIWARYAYGRERKIKLSNLNANQVLASVEVWAMGGHYLNNRKIRDTIPYGFTLKDCEEKYRDPYAVYSKIGCDNQEQFGR